MRTLYRQVADEVTEIVLKITEADLVRPTPCQGWDLRRLLAHQIGQQDGFAEAISSGDAPASRFERETVEADQLPAEWHRSRSALLDAVEAAPEDKIINLADFGAKPVGVAVRMQLLDTAVHGWDLASGLGLSYRPEDAVVVDILHFARLIASRPEGSPAFGPSTEGHGGEDWTMALRLLGRSVDDAGAWTGP